jgi:steroid delta-isomerase-like uncharacterized protein
MSQSNKALARRAFEEVYNRGDLAVVDELVAKDFVNHGSALFGDVHGPEGVKQVVAMVRAAFPDIRITVDDQIAEGDKVVTRWTARATHTGEFQGIAPTGKQGQVTGIDVDRFAGGRVVECWSSMDELGLLQQLGVVPAPEQDGR